MHRQDRNGQNLPGADEHPVTQDFKDWFTHMANFPGHKATSTQSEYWVDSVRNWRHLKLIRKAPHSDGYRQRSPFAFQP